MLVTSRVAYERPCSTSSPDGSRRCCSASSPSRWCSRSPILPGRDSIRTRSRILGRAESIARDGEFRGAANDWNADSTAPLTRFPPGYAGGDCPADSCRDGADARPLASSTPCAAFITVATLVMLVCDATTPIVAPVVREQRSCSCASMHEVHVSVLSEPLYLAVTALALAAMVRRPERPGLTGAVAALAPLVRYVGVLRARRRRVLDDLAGCGRARATASPRVGAGAGSRRAGTLGAAHGPRRQHGLDPAVRPLRRVTRIAAPRWLDHGGVARAGSPPLDVAPAAPSARRRARRRFGHPRAHARAALGLASTPGDCGPAQTRRRRASSSRGG